MDFDLSDEQRLLKESVDRLIADRYDFESRKHFGASPQGYSNDMWRQFAELGVLGVPFSEEDGGFGGGPVETMIIMQAFGKAMTLEPFFSTVVLGGGLLRLAASAEQRADLVPQIAAGELKLAFAHMEKQAGYDLFDVTTSARPDGSGGYVLEGEKSLVLHGEAADKLIVSARTEGSRRDRHGLGLFLVDAKAEGVSRRGYRTQDGVRAAEVSLASVKVGADRVMGNPADALPIIERVIDEAIAALCAEAVGAMDEAQALTLDYMKTRKQFGVTIGSFQALQHHASDMFVMIEQARSMAYFATMMSGEADRDERRKAISAAKVQIGRSARFVGQGAVQLHGGIGMTMEYKVGHLFKRLTMIDTMYGDADHHLEIVASTNGFVEAA